jgi:flagellar hook-associated protein 1 FlgK
MRSTFFGLEIGKRGLQTQQFALEVTGHNIANANTPGFTRQEAVMSTTAPFPTPSLNRAAGAGQVGTGVDITEIRRMRDNFLDMQMRGESRSLGYWEAQSDILAKIEGIVNEPSESGLRTVMENLWKAVEALSNDPESLAARSLVTERAKSLAETFNYLDTKMNELTTDLNSTLQTRVDEVNSLGRQIADLNQQILKVEVTDANANDLRDKRDYLVDQLAKIIDIRVSEDQRGTVTITTSGRPLVQGERSSELVLGYVTGDTDQLYPEIYWADDTVQSVPLDISGGYIRGVIDARGRWDEGDSKGVGFIPAFREHLDTLAREFAGEFNAIHQGGFDLDGIGGDVFFKAKDGASDISAGNIAVNELLLADPRKIAAALLDADGAFNKGDGHNALELAQLKQKKIHELGDFTPEDYYSALIGELGVTAQEAYRMADNQELLVSQIESNRQSVSGVSLDEEIVNMIRFQHAYSAASRLITVMDEMIDLVINRMGLVGR